MKHSIGYQLFARGVLVFIFISLLAIAGQICISLLKQTSNKVFIEYNELDALQEYRTELNHVLIHFDILTLNNDVDTRIKFDKNMESCHLLLDKCEEVLTHRHDRTVLTLLRVGLEELDSLKNILYTNQLTQAEKNQIHENVIRIINEGTLASEEILAETKIEIEEYILTNNTAVLHSTITIISLGVTLLLIVLFGGTLFIKKLTTPISKLLASTKKVSEGKFETVVNIEVNNEFKTLGESFNSMIQTLEKTTISRNYYDSILKNMIEPLIVCDTSGEITTINQAALDILNYNKKEVLGDSLEKLFDASTDTNAEAGIFKEIKIGAISNSERTFLSKDGQKIPVMVATSALKGKNGKISRHILVANDLREKKAIEKKLERQRKEKMIAINDAHEEEKFRIAIDLHDGLGQLLTATSYSLQNLHEIENQDKTEFKENVSFIQAQLDAAIQESKNIAHNLIPIALKEFGLKVAIQNLIEQAMQRCDIIFRFDTFNYNARIHPKMEKALYRIFQEATNNIIKHSQAKNASFQINKYDDVIVVLIEDDGIGFDLNEKTDPNNQNGIGLIGMRERIMAFDGVFTIDTKTNAGTEILIEIPCLKATYGKN